MGIEIEQNIHSEQSPLTGKEETTAG